MALKIIAFGMIAEITGKEFFLQAHDVATLQLALQENFDLMRDKRYAIAVNQKIITGNITLQQTDIVALLPPFAGG